VASSAWPVFCIQPARMSTVATLPNAASRANNETIDLTDSLAALDGALRELEAAPQLQLAVGLSDLRRAVADQVAKLNKREPQVAAVAAAMDVIVRASRTGALDLPLSDEDRERLAKWENVGWPGSLAAMLLTASWRWSGAKVLGQVPEWLWASYTEWLFAAPNPLVTTEDCAIYAAHVGRHAEELARWAERNIGSAAVKSAIEVFARCAPLQPLRYAGVNARVAAESCSRILARVHVRATDPFEPLMLPRLGRSLRVGFLARNWESEVDTCAALARFEQIAPDRAERILFSLAEPMSAFGWHCRDKSQEFHVLPADLAERIRFVRDTNLDALVYVGDTISGDDFSQLALCRLAPVQIVLSESALTSGHAEVDGRVGNAALRGTDEKLFTERLAVLPEGASTYALRRGGDAELAYAREDLGFATDAVVLIAVLSSTHACAESLGTMARILAAAPATRLVLHVLPDAKLSAVGLERFCSVVETVMAQSGVASDRRSIIAPEQATHDESRAIVRLADLFLATPGSSLWAAEALSVGVPVLATNGVEAEWLRSEGLAGLATTDSDTLVATAAALASDGARRAAIKEQLDATTSSGLACADALAASDGFVGVVETIFDRIEAAGQAKFRRDRTPLLTGCESEATPAIDQANAAKEAGDPMAAMDSAQRALGIRPRDAKIRALYGRALLAEGRADRASVYLLAAVQGLNEDADLWFDLATSFRAEAKNSEATQALESALRLNPKRADGWLMLIELAESAGAFDIAQEAYVALKEAAPHHPQLADLAPRFET
jgi:protein O-GlcNAc transferase